MLNINHVGFILHKRLGNTQHPKQEVFFEFVRTKDEYLQVYQKFMCLPLLPPIDIPEAFLALKTLALSYENEAVNKFVR